MLPDGRLSLLYVVHGFPPETWAGTEVYTLNLAKEMQRRGHDVRIFMPLYRRIREAEWPGDAVILGESSMPSPGTSARSSLRRTHIPRHRPKSDVRD